MVRLEWKRHHAVRLWEQLQVAERALINQGFALPKPEQEEMFAAWRGLVALEAGLAAAIRAADEAEPPASPLPEGLQCIRLLLGPFRR